jgi:hypothetical protein
MPTYTFDVLTGLARVSKEEVDRLWGMIPTDWEFDASNASAIYYLSAPLVYGKPDGFVCTLMVHALPNGYPYAFLCSVDDYSDSSPDIFLEDALAVLELLRRYAPLITQSLTPAARADRDLHVKHAAEKERAVVATLRERRSRGKATS